MKVSGRLAALHIASLWCIAVAQPLFDVLRGSPEFFVAHDAGPADLGGLVLLVCLAGPASAALGLWVADRLAPGWRPGAAGIMVGSLAGAVALAALKPLGGWHPGLPLALAAGCGAAAGFAYIRLASFRLFATFLSPALVVVPAAFLEGVPPVVESRRRQHHITPPSAIRQGRHPLHRGAPSASRDAHSR